MAKFRDLLDMDLENIYYYIGCPVLSVGYKYYEKMPSVETDRRLLRARNIYGRSKLFYSDGTGYLEVKITGEYGK